MLVSTSRFGDRLTTPKKSPRYRRHQRATFSIKIFKSEDIGEQKILSNYICVNHNCNFALRVISVTFLFGQEYKE